MTDTGTHRHIPAKNDPPLFRIRVNGKVCYAFKWYDDRTEKRREVNYVLREPTAEEVRCLLVNCPLRIAEHPDLVSVQSTGRILARNGIVWEFAETVWQGGATDDESTVNFCPPEQFPDRALRADLNRMIRECGEGTRPCYDLTLPAPATSELAPVKATAMHARAPGADLPTTATHVPEKPKRTDPDRILVPPCTTCSWIHNEDDYSTFSAPNSNLSFTVRRESAQYRFIRAVHEEMKKRKAPCPRSVLIKASFHDEPANIFRRNREAWGMMDCPTGFVRIAPPAEYRTEKRVRKTDGKNRKKRRKR